ncbi:Transglutaminase-like superfamily protein [Anaerocolumna jejuensis DSM 15929]|uniref:Transglutaminase-like superfamily protein n=1 Tax=Anaerocolumna jejuensis DSM 15929 TaxID=1121322 RepID=A0A1M6T844_9FIRM|nr:leucine-rich repeat protein [Anaerocolumna jejuensis]SHK53120.1 Transglutaminase-like superfamily protein [Anaerocolumna jejuensis DSM 15929]
MKIKKVLLSNLFVCFSLITIFLFNIEAADASVTINGKEYYHYIGGTPSYEGTFSDGTPYKLTTSILRINEDTPSEARVTSISVENKALDVSGKTLTLPSVFQSDDYSYVITSISGAGKLKNLNLVLPDTVTEITDHCFDNYENLTLNIPASVKKLGNNAFDYTTVKKISVSKDSKYLKTENNNLYSYDGKTAYLFNVSDMSTLTVKEGVEHIIDGAIPRYVSIKKVVFPKTIKRIDDYLNEIPFIVFKGAKPPLVSPYFSSPYVKVPQKSLTLYKKAKDTDGNLAFNEQHVFSKSNYYRPAEKYLRSISTKKYLKAAKAKPKDLTDKQWTAIKKKAASITKGATSDREKAQRIYKWIISECYYNLDGLSITDYGMFYIMSEHYDPRADKTYAAFKGKVMIDYGFSNLTVAMMRAAGLPCETILPQGINQFWNTHFSTYANIVYYNKEWHIMKASKDCKNVKLNGELSKNKSPQTLEYFEYDLEVWTYRENRRPALDTSLVPQSLIDIKTR